LFCSEFEGEREGNSEKENGRCGCGCRRRLWGRETENRLRLQGGADW